MAIENRRDPPHHHFQKLGQAIFIQPRKTGKIREQHRPKRPVGRLRVSVTATDFKWRTVSRDRNDAGYAALARPFGAIGRGAGNSVGRTAVPYGKLECLGLHDSGAKPRQTHHQFGAICE